MKQDFLFGELSPDLAPLSNPGLLVADGCIPIGNGYAPFPSFAAASGLTLAAACLGAQAFKTPTGDTELFAGTSTNLYRRNASAWSSIGSGYSAGEFGWKFEQFGSLVIATNGVDVVQKFDMLGGSAAAALGGSPPRARFLAVVRDFVFAAYLNDDGLLMQWSAINNAESWSPTVSLSDYQQFPVGGDITGISGGEYGLVFQEDRIMRATLDGSPAVFRFDEISTNLGCRIPNSIVQEGRSVYFLSNRGFMMCDGQSVTPIGNERVDRAFLDASSKLYHSKMSVAVDPKRKLIIWTLPDKAVPDKLYIYNYSLNRWSTATKAVEYLFTGRTADTSLDDTSVFTLIDDGSYSSLDSAAYRGGEPTLYAFDSSHAFGGFTGSNMAATWGMGDVELVPGRRARVRKAMPMIDATSGLTLTLEGKARHGDSLTTETYTTLQASGYMPCRSNWRTVRPKLAAAAATTWNYCQGLRLDFVEGGER